MDQNSKLEQILRKLIKLTLEFKLSWKKMNPTTYGTLKKINESRAIITIQKSKSKIGQTKYIFQLQNVDTRSIIMTIDTIPDSTNLDIIRTNKTMSLLLEDLYNNIYQNEFDLSINILEKFIK